MEKLYLGILQKCISQKENIEDVKNFDNRRTTYNSIGETSDGKIFYTVQSSNNRSYVYRVSTDGANTWSEPKVFWS